MFKKGVSQLTYKYSVLNSEIHTHKPITLFKNHNFSCYCFGLLSSFFIPSSCYLSSVALRCLCVYQSLIMFYSFAIHVSSNNIFFSFPYLKVFVKCSMVVQLPCSLSCMFLWFIHILACSKNSSNFLWHVNMPSFIFPFFCWWAFRLFPVFCF